MSGTEPRPEAVAAAAWWAARLGRSSLPDIGDRSEAGRESASFAAVVAAATARTFTDAEAARFRDALAVRIEHHLLEWDHAWHPDDPARGSALRYVDQGYGLNPIMRQAAEDAGFTLRLLDLPLQTVTWINPGCVAVAEGHNAEPVQVWP